MKTEGRMDPGRLARLAGALAMPLAVAFAAVLAYAFPATVGGVLKVKMVPYLLGAVMFGMGLTLSARDFLPLARNPKEVAVGVTAQFLLMPLLALAVAKVLALPPELAFGVVLVGCCPGGTASNVMTYLARGDVALSVAMTSCSTLLAPVLTPLAVKLCAGRSVDVDAAAMALSVVEVVIAPVVAGMLANALLPKVCARIRSAMPVFSSTAVVLIAAAVVAASADRLRGNWGLAAVAVVLHNLLGMAAGWLAGRLVGFTVAKRRTLAVEIGMQNSGLAVSLQQAHFAALSLAAVPGALFSVWHNLSGAVYAAWCRSNAAGEV